MQFPDSLAIRVGDRYAVLSLSAVDWIEASGNICPLTPLENHFRELAGQTTYGEGFITHYLGPIIYPAGLTRPTQFMILCILVAVNAIGYALVIRKRRARGAT